MRNQRGSARYAFVDGLRGLAAVSVMLFHLGTGDLRRPLADGLTPRLPAALGYGWLGVHVFFVLSGFVIAHSIGRSRMTARSAFRFVLRRQVRLDPPYWCAIAVGVAFALGARALRPSVPRFVPGPTDVLAHVFYVYDLLGRPGISAVFWSLAIEVQFYLLFVLILWLLQSWPRLVPWFVLASAIASLYWALTWRYPHAWFTQHWYLFALGALVSWTLDRRTHATLPLALGLAFVVAGVRHGRLEPVAGGVVAALLLFAGARGTLGRWFAARPLQFLGVVSYGIYLFHTPFAGSLHMGLARLVSPATLRGALVILTAQIGVTLLVAWGLHRTVEGWAIRLAGRIRWQEPSPRE